MLFFTKGAINVLAIAALVQDGSQEVAMAGCVGRSWKAAMRKTEGWPVSAAAGEGSAGWRAAAGRDSPGKRAKMKKHPIKPPGKCLRQVE